MSKPKFDEAIEELQALYNRIQAEVWVDRRGKRAVLTGINMCISLLKVAQE